MATYDVIKEVCDGCSIEFKPKLMICKSCDPARYRFCFLNHKNRYLNGGVKT